MGGDGKGKGVNFEEGKKSFKRCIFIGAKGEGRGEEEL